MSVLVEEMLKTLEIRSVDSLLPHEETIPYNLKRLKEGMLNLGQLVDPIIVDKKTGLVIDGNHRHKVLEMIECPLAATQAVDYESEDVTLGTWYPVSNLSPQEIVKLDSIRFEKVDLEEGKRAINHLKSPYLIISKEENYLLNPGNFSLKEMIKEQVYIFSLLKKSSLDYVSDIDKEVQAGNTVFYRRSYSKSEVISAAKEKFLFPPKSTRHLVPGRIIRLNMRLGWLHRSKEYAEEEMARNLKSRVYNGNVRKYYEPVYVIY